MFRGVYMWFVVIFLSFCLCALYSAYEFKSGYYETKLEDAGVHDSLRGLSIIKVTKKALL